MPVTLSRLVCRPRLASTFCLLALFAACAPLPDIAAATKTKPGPAPALVPLSGILAQADAVGAGQSSVDTLDARAARLRDRAAALRAE